jgi:hypothetical protein
MRDVTQARCDAIALKLNSRPRKRLGYRTPLEVYQQELSNHCTSTLNLTAITQKPAATLISSYFLRRSSSDSKYLQISASLELNV